MNSNLKLMSNLYIRANEVPLAEDHEFLQHVRGITAIRKLLWKAFEIDARNHDDQEIIRLRQKNRITEVQWQTLRAGIFCFRCDRIPVGMSFGGKYEFRCDENDCK